MRYINLLLIFLIIIFGLLFYIFAPQISKFSQKFFTGTSIAFSFIFNPTYDLKQERGRTNLLILGTGGALHEGANLSDTMILASFSYQTRETILISIPRDLWAQGLGTKINAAYAFGEERGKGQGLALAKKTVADILGIPVHYGLRIDFSGFEKAIDTVGGIEVLVERTFDDFKYPVFGKEKDLCGYKEKEIEGPSAGSGQEKKKIIVDEKDNPVATETAYLCRFQFLHFEAGRQQMDGATALRFVRSRQGTNNEGTDFARARRQQKVMMAFEEKVFSLGTLLNPGKMISLMDSFGESIDTDIKSGEISDFTQFLPSLKEGKVQNYVLSSEGDPPAGGLLEVGQPKDYGGAWVLVAKNGDWQKIKDEVQKILWPK